MQLAISLCLLTNEFEVSMFKEVRSSIDIGFFSFHLSVKKKAIPVTGREGP
jgi:hypothetical protein